MLEVSLLSLFLSGLLGGVHCAGMCGGLVGAMSINLPTQHRFPLIVGYNLGRIASYMLAGILAGALGASSLLLAHLIPVALVLYVLANLLLIGLGLYLAGLSNAVTRLEKIGGHIWRHIQPQLARHLPIRSLQDAWWAGMLWGWLPCGLVYTALVSALASGSPLHGGLVMLAFGLGTLPNLLILGLSAERMMRWLKQAKIRMVAGLIVASFGVIGLIRIGMFLSPWALHQQ
ncbi:sulfite exporter TauE/SafE family protein [Chitinivorax sp. B]|uniref:sulfite exporter TauE/SafE family protein n=1 Tax=Chitinivorax sp. B TaxID=2502235 RepID=UPI0010F642F5|nr:sulfite exporter TauE/SafE family protein [Chitinivorax sp. B]